MTGEVLSGNTQTPPQEQREIPQAVRIAVLISNKGTGSNLGAIINAINEGTLKNTQVGLVISDKSDAQGLQRAERYQIPSIVRELRHRKDSSKRNIYSRELAELLNANGIQIAVLAGFMTILSPLYRKTFAGETINIHPGGIPYAKGRPYFTEDGKESPWNQGMMTEAAVGQFLNQGLKYAVSTVHVVTDEPDFGPVLERGIEEIKPNDTVDLLYNRLKLKEHAALVRALQNPRRIFEKAGRAVPRGL